MEDRLRFAKVHILCSLRERLISFYQADPRSSLLSGTVHSSVQTYPLQKTYSCFEVVNDSLQSQTSKFSEILLASGMGKITACLIYPINLLMLFDGCKRRRVSRLCSLRMKYNCIIIIYILKDTFTENYIIINILH